jgi:hypothetical protein
MATYSEQRIAAMQRRIHADANRSPAEIEARNLTRIAVDTAKKTPKDLPAPWVKDKRGQG